MTIMKIKTASEMADANYNLGRLLDTPGGFEKIAAEKLPPFIREQRDYEAFGRKVLLTHPVTSEEMHIIDNEPYIYYPKDLNSHAAFYADDSEIPKYAIEGDGVNVGIITISSDDTTIHLKRLLTQRYAYLDRVRELSGIAVAKAEDFKIVQMVDGLLSKNTKQIVAVNGRKDLQKQDLVALRKPFSRNAVDLASYVMNPSTLDDMLLWGQDEIDQLTQRELLEMGVKYTIWGLPIITSTIIKPEVVYAFAPQDFVGRMPILKDLTVKLTETDNKLEKGLFMFEFVGFYIASHKAVAKLVLNCASAEEAAKVSGLIDELAEDNIPGIHDKGVKDNGSLQTGLTTDLPQ